MAENSCWPRPTFAPAVLTWASEGVAGPPPSEPMYSATSRVCLGVSRGGFWTFSAPCSAAGIRPVLTWKSTAAEPTPIRPGAWLVPWA